MVRRSFASLGRAKIVKSFLVQRLMQKEFVSWLQMSFGDVSRIQKLNNTMKKLLFLGAFALFAFAASAQSTQAPADKKAKTEQTCSKDAQKTSCTKGDKATCDKSKSAGCCSKGASASTNAKGSFLQQVFFCRLLQQVRQSASATTDDKKSRSTRKSLATQATGMNDQGQLIPAQAGKQKRAVHCGGPFLCDRIREACLFRHIFAT